MDPAVSASLGMWKVDLDDSRSSMSQLREKDTQIKPLSGICVSEGYGPQRQRSELRAIAWQGDLGRPVQICHVGVVVHLSVAREACGLRRQGESLVGWEVGRVQA